MPLGTVTITTGAAGPAAFPAVEGCALFIGVAATGTGALNAVGPDTDLTTLFGAGSLADTLDDARANGGPDWRAYAIGHTAVQGWSDVIDTALAGCNPEAVVVCKPVTAGAELTAMQTKATTLLGLAKRVFFMAAFRGIAAETWAAYLTAATALTTSISAQRVMVVPLLWGSELGAFAGRLQSFALTDKKVSRTPMRVRSGAVVNPGTTPVDSAAAPISRATLIALDAVRFSVFQKYEGREGVYFADGNTLEAAGGDFPRIEHLRVIDKAARQVRILAEGEIGNDQVQNTPGGNAAFASYLGRPLREMAQAGEIKPLTPDAITVTWTSATAVSVFMKIWAANAPKSITVAITLDTTSA